MNDDSTARDSKLERILGFIRRALRRTDADAIYHDLRRQEHEWAMREAKRSNGPAVECDT